MGGGNRARKWLWLALVLLGLLALPVPVVSRLEERDTFCVSCHTAPEEVYYARTQTALAEPLAGRLDLASAHYALDAAFRCIACHRGSGSPVHRAQTLALGARDTLIWLSGRADPALEKTTPEAPGLLNAGCLKCHPETLLLTGFNNHFHNRLPEAFAAWQAGGELTVSAGSSPLEAGYTPPVSETTVTCLACHRVHVSLPDGAFTLFMDIERVVYPACVQCHREAGHGPVDLVAPGG